MRRTTNRIPNAITTITKAVQLPAAAIAAAAAQVMDEKASDNVAIRDDEWRRWNWLRFICVRNHNWITIADIAEATIAPAATAATFSEKNSSPRTSGANTIPMKIITASILLRSKPEGDTGAVLTRSGASSPEIVSHARAPAN